METDEIGTPKINMDGQDRQDKKRMRDEGKGMNHRRLVCCFIPHSSALIPVSSPVHPCNNF
jgi:hypothetical protein